MRNYTDVLDRLLAILEENRDDALSEDLSTSVVSVNKGQYTVTPGVSKPCIFACFKSPALVANMAGNRKRQETVMFQFSGAVTGTQGVASDDATNLMLNLANILENHASDALWGGGTLGWSYSDSNPTRYGEVILEPGQDITTGHFTLLWSCDVMIATKPLT